MGIDLEKIVPLGDLDDVVERHFSSDEQVVYRGSCPESRVELFYEMWTAKEAVLKARGVGLEPELAEVDALADGLHIVRPGIAAGYSCALAVEGNGWHLAEVDLG